MKKINSLVLLFVLALTTLCSIAFAAKGESNIAVPFAVVSFVVGFAVPTNPLKTNLGFNAYFGDLEPMGMTVSQKALWDYLTREGSDINTKEALYSKNLQIATYSEALKFRVAVSSGGKIELLNATAAYLQGTIPLEFNLGFLPKGFSIAVSHLRLAFGSDAALLPGAIANYTTVAAGWPAALQNGQIIVSQNNAVKEQFTCRAAGTAAASTQQSIAGDGFEFQSPMILEEGKPIKIELFTPTGITFAATPVVQAVEVAFYGACVRPRS